MVALGSRPHFDRPNLPVPPGYHPAGIQVSLRPFDLDTLDHFIFLERPLDAPLEDSSPYRAMEGTERGAEVGVLMPSAPNYATIGEFYQLLADGLDFLSARLGADRLFVGPADCQMEANEIGVDELSVVTDLASARRAIHLIIVQGEGASATDDDSHYRHFLRIREEFNALRRQRDDFCPSRDVASNPVMRRPLSDDRVHITAQPAASVLDAANAVYSLMLRFLVEIYETPREPAGRRRALLGGATGLMKVLGELSDALTKLPATLEGSQLAGVTFAMLRSTEGLAPGVDALGVLVDRLEDIAKRLPGLGLSEAQEARVDRTVLEIQASLLAVRNVESAH